MDYQLLKNKSYSQSSVWQKDLGESLGWGVETQDTISFQPIPLALGPDPCKRK